MKYKTPSCCRSSFGFHFCDSDFRSCILFSVLRQGCLMRIYARNIEVFVSKYKMALLLVWRICTLCAQNNKRANLFLCPLIQRVFLCKFLHCFYCMQELIIFEPAFNCRCDVAGDNGNALWASSIAVRRLASAFSLSFPWSFGLSSSKGILSHLERNLQQK